MLLHIDVKVKLITCLTTHVNEPFCEIATEDKYRLLLVTTFLHARLVCRLVHQFFNLFLGPRGPPLSHDKQTVPKTWTTYEQQRFFSRWKCDLVPRRVRAYFVSLVKWSELFAQKLSPTSSGDVFLCIAIQLWGKRKSGSGSQRVFSSSRNFPTK